jgi:hypothetical protein
MILRILILGFGLLASAFAACSSTESPVTNATDRGSADGGPSPTGCSLACGLNGRCDASRAVQVCVCDPGYTGATCGECAPGAGPDGKGGCAIACGSRTCERHERCTDSNVGSICACAPGYLKEGAGCTFRGGPLDPTFEKKPDAWQVSNGAVIDAGAVSVLGVTLANPGFATLPGGPSAGPATITQSFEMPTTAEAEPLSLKVNGYAEGGLRISSQGRNVPIRSALRPSSVAVQCLGERWFGKRIDLTLASANTGNGDTVFLDDVRFAPDPSCPDFGKFLNADFEQPSGWTVLGAQILAGIGVNQTGGLKVGDAAISKVSVPFANTPKLAMWFSVRGSASSRVTISLNDVRFVVAAPSLGFQKAFVCVPESVKGDVVELSFIAESGTDMVIDELRFEPNPSCPSGPL